MTSPFTVFICHGFFATPAAYLPLIDALKARGVEAHCKQLPTSDLSKHNVGDVKNPNFDLESPPDGYSQGDDDTKVVTEALRRLVEEQGKNVLVLAHSAGGWVATQSAVPELHERIRREKGLTGGIIGIMYFAAFIIPVGESIHSFFRPKDGSVFVPDWVNVHVSLAQVRVILTLNSHVGKRSYNIERSREIPPTRSERRRHSTTCTKAQCIAIR